MKGTKEIVKSERRFVSPFDEMERWLENVWARPYSLFRSPLWPERSTEGEELLPSVDIYEEGNELVVKADLPGVKKEDLRIDIADNIVKISGRKEREEKVKSEHYYRFERTHGSFSRGFELPSGMDSEKARAHYEHGVLEVRIPRSEETAAKKAGKSPSNEHRTPGSMLPGSFLFSAYQDEIHRLFRVEENDARVLSQSFPHGSWEMVGLLSQLSAFSICLWRILPS